MILQRRRGEIYAGPGALNDADGIGGAVGRRITYAELTA